MKKIVVLIICIQLFSSCIPSRRLIKKSKYKAATFSPQNLNGDYKNEKRLWNRLASLTNINHFIKRDSLTNGIVKLKLVSKDELLVELRIEGNLIHQMVLKGKVKKDYFSIKRRFSIFPLYPILYNREEQKVLLGNDKNGDLILLEGNVSEGAILVLAAGQSWEGSHKVTKIKSS